MRNLITIFMFLFSLSLHAQVELRYNGDKRPSRNFKTDMIHADLLPNFSADKLNEANTIFEEDRIRYYIINDDEVGVTHKDPNDEINYTQDTIIIPEHVLHDGHNYIVSAIGNYAFTLCQNLKKVVIPNTVTSIGYYAFYKCSSLTSICLPESLDIIDYGVFDECTSLKDVTIPSSIKTIGVYAFDECTELSTVYASDLNSWCQIDFCSITSNPLIYAQHLVIDGEEITDLVIPNSVTDIKPFSFTGYSGLKSVTFPNSVNSIGREAFSYCFNLTDIDFGDGITTIDYRSFFDCENLTNMTLPTSLTYLSHGAFSFCI